MKAIPIISNAIFILLIATVLFPYQLCGQRHTMTSTFLNGYCETIEDAKIFKVEAEFSNAISAKIQQALEEVVAVGLLQKRDELNEEYFSKHATFNVQRGKLFISIDKDKVSVTSFNSLKNITEKCTDLIIQGHSKQHQKSYETLIQLNKQGQKRN